MRERKKNKTGSGRMMQLDWRTGFVVAVGILAFAGWFFPMDGLSGVQMDVTKRAVSDDELVFVTSSQVETSNVQTEKYEVYDCHKYLHAGKGSLPHFIVAGVHKGGSTALFDYLMHHGMIRPPSCKETNFFAKDARYKRGISFYKRHFPDLRSTPEILTGEGTPNYMRIPLAVERLVKHVPHVKLIVTLRDPTERFISHFVGFRDRKLTQASCQQFWHEALTEINSCIAQYNPATHQTFPTTIPGLSEMQMILRARKGESLVELHQNRASLATNRTVLGCKRNKRGENCIRRYCYTLLHENPIVRSIYVDQIVRLLSFFPAPQIFVVQSELLHKDLEHTMQRLTRFLGIREFTRSELASFQKTMPGSAHHLNPLSDTCDRETFRGFFDKENDLLEDVLKVQWPLLYGSFVTWGHWRFDSLQDAD